MEHQSQRPWECRHVGRAFRVGGNAGSKLTAKECPRLCGTINGNCIAVNLMMHITTWGSGYFENVWGWTADHDLEALDGDQIDISTGRGILIESVNPTWLYGTGFEHAVMYQYMVHGANNLFMGLIQTESPYFQSLPPAPKPFGKSVGLFRGDPKFTECNSRNPSSCMAWGVMVERSSNVLIYGAGIYSWFQKYTQDCLKTFSCQQSIVRLSDDKNIYIYNLATVGSTNMITSPGARLDGLVHQSPRSNVSSINGWLGDVDGSDPDGGNKPGEKITLGSSIWLWPATQPDNNGTMTVACTPPCVFQFPPLTFPPLQPPPTTTTIDGKPYVVTPPALKNATLQWDPVSYNNTSGGVVTVTPAPNATTISVPPRDCGAACGGHKITFPPVVLPIPTPRDAPCWIYCDPAVPIHPPVVLGTGPPPGPKPPGSDDDDDLTPPPIIIPHSLPKCTPDTCPAPCSGPDCTEGQDCKGPLCILGGSCLGPRCTRAGDCEGPKCVGGGDCQGDGCEHGGKCEGDECDKGGDCTGTKCKKGGDCTGKKCDKGGGCEGPSCHSGDCTGPNCAKTGGGGGCTGANCPCQGPNCGTSGCVGPTCDTGPGCTGPDCNKNGEDDGEEEDEEEGYCESSLIEDVPYIDTPDGSGATAGGKAGGSSNSGGNTGQGGVNGSGVGCLDENGVIYPCGAGGGDPGNGNAGGSGGGGDPGGQDPCGAEKPQATYLPPPGTQCSKDVDCADFQCPGCQWAGCLKFSPASGLTCQCLPTETGQIGSQQCGIDYDCAYVQCPGGQWPRCLKFTMTPATCQCMDMSGEPPGGTDCKVGYDCVHYKCPQGNHPACLKFTMGAGPTCQCVPN